MKSKWPALTATEAGLQIAVLERQPDDPVRKCRSKQPLPGSNCPMPRGRIRAPRCISGRKLLARCAWRSHLGSITPGMLPCGSAPAVLPRRSRQQAGGISRLNSISLTTFYGYGWRRQLVLRPMPVAEFYLEFLQLLSDAGIKVRITDMPNEIAEAIPFSRDLTHTAYDREFVHRFWQILLVSHEVFSYFRSSFIGKTSPVHFFWGSFDLAVTRFSGRRAPMHPGGVPHLSDAVVREAYSHEVSSAGFWPGGGPIDYPAYYSYAYPPPERFASAAVRPAQAFFSNELGEFILPYDAVRTAPDPKGALIAFLQSTYSAAAEKGNWDRSRSNA